MTAHVQENPIRCWTMQQAMQITCVDAEHQSLREKLEKRLDTLYHQQTDHRCYFIIHHGCRGLA